VFLPTRLKRNSALTVSWRPSLGVPSVQPEILVLYARPKT
jgi:hypothetical protein